MQSRHATCSTYSVFVIVTRETHSIQLYSKNCRSGHTTSFNSSPIYSLSSLFFSVATTIAISFAFILQFSSSQSPDLHEFKKLCCIIRFLSIGKQESFLDFVLLFPSTSWKPCSFSQFPAVQGYCQVSFVISPRLVSLRDHLV